MTKSDEDLLSRNLTQYKQENNKYSLIIYSPKCYSVIVYSKKSCSIIKYRGKFCSFGRGGNKPLDALDEILKSLFLIILVWISNIVKKIKNILREFILNVKNKFTSIVVWLLLNKSKFNLGFWFLLLILVLLPYALDYLYTQLYIPFLKDFWDKPINTQLDVIDDENEIDIDHEYENDLPNTPNVDEPP